MIQNPPPWTPTNVQDTTPGMGDHAELLMVWVVNTGIINVNHMHLAVSSANQLVHIQTLPGSPRVLCQIAMRKGLACNEEGSRSGQD
jgi:hypothetical protein